MDERQLRDRWHDSSTNLVERYEMSLRGARGVVVRQRNNVVGYSAYTGYAGRQQWAEQLFDDMQNTQAWCARALVARTSYEKAWHGFGRPTTGRIVCSMQPMQLVLACVMLYR